jgi:hypothetical protein
MLRKPLVSHDIRHKPLEDRNALVQDTLLRHVRLEAAIEHHDLLHCHCILLAVGLVHRLELLDRLGVLVLHKLALLRVGDEERLLHDAVQFGNDGRWAKHV